ncbi:tetratricopeptide repeat protein [Polaromonas sp. OV174]|uniref:tetratricopeptide repeat protein n=1 Tax=Polaromonas sp. OV174 TaxID=1855300 RepID=UPI00210173B7|nr:tetratricopeptide repeat protein [Polaromonas sp. OV174]
MRLHAMALLAIGRRSRALSGFERMLRCWPADPYALASRAHVQVQLNRFDEAIVGLQQLCRLTGPVPQQAVSCFNLGYVLQLAGRHDEAGPAFQQALALDARMDRAWYGLALVLIEQRQFPEALKALQQNTALQPMSPHGWYRLAQVRLALGQPDEARKVIAHLRRFEPRVAAQLERETGLGQPARMSNASVAGDAAY